MVEDPETSILFFNIDISSKGSDLCTEYLYRDMRKKCIKGRILFKLHLFLFLFLLDFLYDSEKCIGNTSLHALGVPSNFR